MSDHDDNPFVRFGLDPEASLAELTERLRELAEDAPDEATRVAIRAAWEGLTRSPARRLELVLEAGPRPDPIPPEPPLAPPPPWPEPRLSDVSAPLPLAPRLPPPSAEERALSRVELGFLIRGDEESITGDVGQGRAR